MDPVLAQALATLAGAIATAILMAASYYWGPGQRRNRRDEREHRDDRRDDDRDDADDAHGPTRRSP